MSIITKDLILSSDKIKKKLDLFNVIADVLFKKKFITDKKKLIKDLQYRENIGSTAFENGLMIPHCRTDSVKETKLVIVKFPDREFNSIDKKKTNFAVCILVPKSLEKEHLSILSKISSIFSTSKSLEAFKKLSIDNKVKKIINVTKAKKEKKNENKVIKYDFVAVTSCAAGIAHTYMARDGLLEAAEKLGLKAKVETRGAITENSLTDSDIDAANFVIIAADVDIPQTRFSGKKLYITDTNDAIRDSEKVISKAKESQIFYGKAQKLGKLTIGGKDKKKRRVLGKAVMSALSFMIPIVIAGGILMSIPNALAAGGNTHGGTWHFPNKFVEALWQFGHIGLILMVPIFAMFLAFKIGGKPAMPASLIGGFFINDGSLMGKYSLFDLPKTMGGAASAGFLGGLLVGIFVGYLVKAMQWIKWHRYVKPVSNLMIVPILSSFITFLFVVYVIGSPMTWVMAQLYNGLAAINGSGMGVSVGIGILFAMLMSIDLGGPINKTTLTVATIIFADTYTKWKSKFYSSNSCSSSNISSSIRNVISYYNF